MRQIIKMNLTKVKEEFGGRGDERTQEIDRLLRCFAQKKINLGVIIIWRGWTAVTVVVLMTIPSKYDKSLESFFC